MLGLTFAENKYTRNLTPRQSRTPSHTDTKPGIDPQNENTNDQVNAALLAWLPWGTSLLFHAGLVLLAIFLVWVTIEPIDKQEPPIIPDVAFSPTPDTPLQTREPKPTITPRPRITNRNIRQTTAPLNTQVDARIPLIGAIGPASGKPTPFGTTPRTGPPNTATFVGTSGNADRLVYLIDASGSLLDSMPFVINEIKQSIKQLSDSQKFTVIFFQGQEAIEISPPGLKKATPQNKQLVINWLDMDSGNVVPKGRANPVKAIAAALRHHPQLIFLLSDNITGQGQYEVNQQRLLAQIKKANTANTKINTIQFLYPDPLTKAGLKPTMELISLNSGGKYKFVDGRELGIHW